MKTQNANVSNETSVKTVIIHYAYCTNRQLSIYSDSEWLRQQKNVKMIKKEGSVAL